MAAVSPQLARSWYFKGRLCLIGLHLLTFFCAVIVAKVLADETREGRVSRWSDGVADSQTWCAIIESGKLIFAEGGPGLALIDYNITLANIMFSKSGVTSRQGDTHHCLEPFVDAAASRTKVQEFKLFTPWASALCAWGAVKIVVPGLALALKTVLGPKLTLSAGQKPNLLWSARIFLDMYQRPWGLLPDMLLTPLTSLERHDSEVDTVALMTACADFDWWWSLSFYWALPFYSLGVFLWIIFILAVIIFFQPFLDLGLPEGFTAKARAAAESIRRRDVKALRVLGFTTSFVGGCFQMPFAYISLLGSCGLKFALTFDFALLLRVRLEGGLSVWSAILRWLLAVAFVLGKLLTLFYFSTFEAHLTIETAVETLEGSPNVRPAGKAKSRSASSSTPITIGAPRPLRKKQIQVTVLPGMGPGSRVQVLAPDGTVIEAVVPSGVPVGRSFGVEY